MVLVQKRDANQQDETPIVCFLTGGLMRKGWSVGLLIMAFAAICPAAQRGADATAAGDEYVGTWSGTWDSGASGGGFELTLERAKDNTIGGKVAVTGQPTYNAVLKTVSFEGTKMTAKYDFPPDESAEVILTTTFEGNKAAGTWTLRVKGTSNDVATGGWTVKRK